MECKADTPLCHSDRQVHRWLGSSTRSQAKRIINRAAYPRNISTTRFNATVSSALLSVAAAMPCHVCAGLERRPRAGDSHGDYLGSDPARQRPLSPKPRIGASVAGEMRRRALTGFDRVQVCDCPLSLSEWHSRYGRRYPRK